MQEKVLIVDQQAVARQYAEQMAGIIATMAQLQAVVTPSKDFNRRQMRQFEARMRPIRVKMARLKVQAAALQKKCDEALGNDASTKDIQ
jgi:hypothetical protein